MYIVLTAMLALNVSSDVLNGFNQVESGLVRTNRNFYERNKAIFGQLEAFMQKNPEKVGVWFDKATELRAITDSLFNDIETIKHDIVAVADGSDADVLNIKNLDNLDAASIVMLSPTTMRGTALRKQIDDYRTYVTSLMTDSVKRQNIDNALATRDRRQKGTLSDSSWEEGLFDNMPVVAAVALLTKIQNDVRYAEGEALNTLLTNVDAGDVRVNEVSAFVIPSSRNVMRGSKYTANIVLAAVDTTQRPVVFVNGTKLDNDRGLYEVVTGRTGEFDYNGYIEVPRGDGTSSRLDFSSSYTVIEPMATVSATMMNVLYAGIDNPASAPRSSLCLCLVAVPKIASTFSMIATEFRQLSLSLHCVKCVLYCCNICRTSSSLLSLWNRFCRSASMKKYHLPLCRPPSRMKSIASK